MSKNACKIIKSKKLNNTTNHNKSKKFINQIPKDILNNESLNEAIKILPSNYNFEIHKTIWRIKREAANRVALQFPEGLLIYSCIISNILQRFANVETVIFGEVTYGACCIEDNIAKSLNCDLLVHYGHSCLIPITITKFPTIYIFVEIEIDVNHFIDTLKFNLPKTLKIAIAGTVQFIGALHSSYDNLKEYFSEVVLNQESPLSFGEVLGCTSPKYSNVDCIIFIADGRFHLESIMIRNPNLTAYKYNPYSKSFTVEKYDYSKMMSIRRNAIDMASKAKKWGVILSTLGRQGNPKILERIKTALDSRNLKYFVILITEISPSKLRQFKDIEAWIQIGCPRLSIDWGYSYDVPLLSPYEGFVALENVQWRDDYPMDYYSNNGGLWSNYYKTEEEKELERKKKLDMRKKWMAMMKKSPLEIKLAE